MSPDGRTVARIAFARTVVCYVGQVGLWVLSLRGVTTPLDMKLGSQAATAPRPQRWCLDACLCSLLVWKGPAFAFSVPIATPRKGEGGEDWDPFPASAVVACVWKTGRDSLPTGRNPFARTPPGPKAVVGHSQKHKYVMDLGEGEVIDASRKGTILRFVNHSCGPNAETQKWAVQGRRRIGLFAKEEISPGDEVRARWHGVPRQGFPFGRRWSRLLGRGPVPSATRAVWPWRVENGQRCDYRGGGQAVRGRALVGAPQDARPV